MKNYLEINSNLDALKVKEFESEIYKLADKDSIIVQKVIPFRGINTDMLYIRDNKMIFIKIMDTVEELFSILGEELLEIMNEEYNLLINNMSEKFPDIQFNYIFIMPYVDINDTYQYGDFVKNNVVTKSQINEISNDIANGKSKDLFDNYLKQTNEEVHLNIFFTYIMPENYVVSQGVNYNKEFKKISFSNGEGQYILSPLDYKQINMVNNVDYGNHIIVGGSGTGKSTIMLCRALKLSRIYPHHTFLIITNSKQVRNQLRELTMLSDPNVTNIEIHTYSSFIFRLAKKYELIIDYTKLKKDFEKTFDNIVKQVKNMIKDKKMFKGIFIDEAENFTESELLFIYDFLYETKNIFDVYSCKALNIGHNLDIFKCKLKAIEYEDEIHLKNNYRQTKDLVEFVNKFSKKATSMIKNIRKDVQHNIFYETKPLREGKNSIDLIKVNDLDDQISSVIWEIEHLVKDKGFNYSDIVVIYPFNKKKLKNGKIIYFQYMLRKSLEEAGIHYIYAEEDLTNLSKKTGITISNIYTIKGLVYKVAIVCELEMLYNQKLLKEDSDYQINDFVSDLNKLYLAINRASEHLSIITTFNEASSDIIKVIVDSAEE